MKDIKELIAAMTVEEKVALLNGKGLWRSKANHRLNIPDFVMTDGTYGVRYSGSQIDSDDTWEISQFFEVVNQDAGEGLENAFGKSKPATCFPNGSALGCSWDVDLVEEMGEALGRECQSMGVGLLLGPGINIRRTPLAGRGYEYYSEDPVVSGDLAGAIIKGIQSKGVGTSLKHFACNNSEIQRCSMDSLVEERALREIYLHGFERAIKISNPWTVMSSYNYLNGIKASQDPWLLTEVLRNDWGYEGLVVSDWGGIVDRSASVNAGGDLDMPESAFNQQKLLEAVSSGEVPIEMLDQSCERMLKLIEKATALMEEEPFELKAHHELARKIASESIVLLKNEEKLLPLDSKETKKILVLGESAVQPVYQGSGCATTLPTFLDHPLSELEALRGNNTVTFASGYSDTEEEQVACLEEAVGLAKNSDTVIIYASTEVGEDGEGVDRKNLNLVPSHEKLIEVVAEVNRRVIVVLANGDSVVMPWLPKVSAVIETFFAGQGMGKAVADIIFGHVNPSGKLSVTFPEKITDLPNSIHYPGENYEHLYSEGIFVGYRYYEKKALAPLFPFGHGLSYTEYAYTDLEVSQESLLEGEPLNLSFKLTNTGNMSGKEIVQLYVRDKESTISRPLKELKHFKKIELQPRETKLVTFEMNDRDFAFYDPVYGKWLVETGEFDLCVGSSSEAIHLKRTLHVTGKQPYYPIIRPDTPIKMLLENPIAVERFIEIISSKLEMNKEQVLSLLTNVLVSSFWGIYQTLTEQMGIIIEKGEFNQILDDINSQTISGT